MGLTIKTSDIRRLVREAMHKRLPDAERGETFPVFSGRKPKSVQSRINQIQRLCNSYHLSTRKFPKDETWVATDIYKRAIESLGYHVIYSVDGDGYGNYDQTTHQPMSKTYNIRLEADDGMVITGHLELCACGTVEDPFSQYDTILQLTPRDVRNFTESVRKSELRAMIREALRSSLNEWDADDPDEGPEDYASNESPSNEFSGIYDLTTNEVFDNEETPEIDVNNDEFGGEHKYVCFWAIPEDYNIDSADDTWENPGYWCCEINGYNIETDGIVYQTNAYDDATAVYDLEIKTGEQFEGFSDEQRKQIESYLDREISTDFWGFQ